MSARGQVLNLLADIQEGSGLACVHISHDLFDACAISATGWR